MHKISPTPTPNLSPFLSDALTQTTTFTLPNYNCCMQCSWAPVILSKVAPGQNKLSVPAVRSVCVQCWSKIFVSMLCT